MSRKNKKVLKQYAGKYIGEGAYGCVIDFEDLNDVIKNANDSIKHKENGGIDNLVLYPELINRKLSTKNIPKLNGSVSPSNGINKKYEYDNKVAKIMIRKEPFFQEITTTEIVKRIIGNSDIMNSVYMSFEIDMSDINTKAKKSLMESIKECRLTWEITKEFNMLGAYKDWEFIKSMSGGGSKENGRFSLEVEKLIKTMTSDKQFNAKDQKEFLKTIKDSDKKYGSSVSLRRSFNSINSDESEDSLYIIVSEKGTPVSVKSMRDFKKMYNNLDYVITFLEKLNRKMYVHNDVKVDNMLFNKDGNVIMIDYGLIYSLEGTTNTFTTPLIRSPINILKINLEEDMIDLEKNPYEITEETEEAFTALYYGIDLLTSGSDFIDSHELSLKNELEIDIKEEYRYVVDSYKKAKNKEKWFKDRAYYFDFFGLGISLFRELSKVSKKYPKKVNKNGDTYKKIMHFIRSLTSIRYLEEHMGKTMNNTNIFKYIHETYEASKY